MSKEEKILYHYTCEIHLGSIMRSQMLQPTFSNVNQKNIAWLTSSPSPKDLGIGIRGGVPAELDKTRYRFAIRWEPHFKKWTQWCQDEGIDPEASDLLARTCGETDTSDSWYVSEEPIAMTSWLSVDNLATGKRLWDPSCE